MPPVFDLYYCTAAARSVITSHPDLWLRYSHWRLPGQLNSGSAGSQAQSGSECSPADEQRRVKYYLAHVSHKTGTHLYLTCMEIF